MANITLYKDGKTREVSEGGADYYVKNYGWSKDAPTADTTVDTTAAKSTAGSSGYDAYTQYASQKSSNTTTPSPITTSDQARKETADNAKSYIQYAGSPDVYNKATGAYVPYEEAQAKNIWDNIQVSQEARPEGLSTPVESIQSVLGSNWNPTTSAELQAQGVYGAVKIGDNVYTIGTGGKPVSGEEYQSLFGTSDTSGATSVSLEDAVKLGITPTQNDISSFNDNLYESIYSINTLGELAQKSEEVVKNAYAEADKIQTQINDSYTNLINAISTFSEKKATAKEEQEEGLGLDEKSNAISEAQKAYSTVKAQYDTYLNKIKYSSMTTAHIGGLDAQARAQMATELAPLESAIAIAEDNYDRAKTILDDWSEEYNTNYEYLLNAYQQNINALGSALTYEQTKAQTEAQQKLNLLTQSYNEMLSTQEEVKTLQMAYPEAKITISDDWSTAYKKASPYIQSEKELAARLSASGTTTTEETPVTYASALNDTIDYLEQLKADNNFNDYTYKQAIRGFMQDFPSAFDTDEDGNITAEAYNNFSSFINQKLEESEGVTVKETIIPKGGTVAGTTLMQTGSGQELTQ